MGHSLFLLFAISKSGAEVSDRFRLKRPGAASQESAIHDDNLSCHKI